MTFICTISQAIAITSATVANIDKNTQATTEIRGVVSDSRKIKAGELFVALTGENFDGHGFVATAIAQGAVAAIVSHEWANSASAEGLWTFQSRTTGRSPQTQEWSFMYLTWATPLRVLPMMYQAPITQNGCDTMQPFLGHQRAW